jgi:hypothetical protein
MRALQKMADYFHITKSSIIEDEQSANASLTIPGAFVPEFKKSIPILGCVSAGKPLYADEDVI